MLHYQYFSLSFLTKVAAQFMVKPMTSRAAISFWKPWPLYPFLLPWFSIKGNPCDLRPCSPNWTFGQGKLLCAVAERISLKIRGKTMLMLTNYSQLGHHYAEILYVFWMISCLLILPTSFMALHHIYSTEMEKGILYYDNGETLDTHY